MYLTRHNAALDVIVHKDIQLPSDINQLTKVAELKFNRNFYLSIFELNDFKSQSSYLNYIFQR